MLHGPSLFSEVDQYLKLLKLSHMIDIAVESLIGDELAHSRCQLTEVDVALSVPLSRAELDEHVNCEDGSRAGTICISLGVAVRHAFPIGVEETWHDAKLFHPRCICRQLMELYRVADPQI